MTDRYRKEHAERPTFNALAPMSEFDRLKAQKDAALDIQRGAQKEYVAELERIVRWYVMECNYGGGPDDARWFEALDAAKAVLARKGS